MEYLFSRWEELKRELSGKFIFLYLDYDGTLVPIANKPEEAVLSLKTKELLISLRDISCCKIAIISGRSLDDIKKLVSLEGITYVGNHGLEIEGPKIKFRISLSSAYIRLLQRIKGDLLDKISSLKGAFIEDKGLSLSLHYRQVDKKEIPELKSIFHETINYHLLKERLRIKAGKMVLEIRPPSILDKGKVTLWLLAQQRFALKDKTEVIPLYIGDDLSDEDAFKALKDKGITIRVGEVKDTYAKYYLKDVPEVFRLLEDIKKALV